MQIIESYLEMPYRNISSTYHSFFTQRQTVEREEKELLYAKARGNNAVAEFPLKAYQGRYLSDVYGFIDITEKEGKLHILFAHHPDLTAELEPLGGHSFVCTYNQSIYGVKEVHFTANAESVESYTMTVADFIDKMEYQFNRVRK